LLDPLPDKNSIRKSTIHQDFSGLTGFQSLETSAASTFDPNQNAFEIKKTELLN
jgi:hypothetical protein